MLKLDIRLLDACPVYQWYVKTGCVSIKLPKKPTSKDGFDVVFIGDYPTLNNMLVHFGKKSLSSIQLGLKHSGLKECLIANTGEVFKYDPVIAGKYLDLIAATKKPKHFDCDRKKCGAYGLCQDGLIPEPNQYNCKEYGWNKTYFNPDLFIEFGFKEFNPKFGNVYEFFVNGLSCEGKPGFSSKQIHEQFKNKQEFKHYVESDV